MKFPLCILILSYCLMSFLHAGEALGVKYDEVYLLRLKAGHKKIDHTDLIVKNGKQPACALETFKVKEKLHPSIDKIFPVNGKYDHGLADCTLQLYALVFYKNGKPVLSIAPNLIGGDLYASNRSGHHSLSRKQRDAYVDLVLSIMMTSGKEDLPTVKKQTSTNKTNANFLDFKEAISKQVDPEWKCSEIKIQNGQNLFNVKSTITHYSIRIRCHTKINQKKYSEIVNQFKMVSQQLSDSQLAEKEQILTILYLDFLNLPDAIYKEISVSISLIHPDLWYKAIEAELAEAKKVKQTISSLLTPYKENQ